MIDRIDHAAEAAKWIADADNARRHPDGGQSAIVSGLFAQAEATLALVEQQRIANLIALSGYDHRPVPDDLSLMGQVAAYELANPDTAAALGIEEYDHD